MYLGNKDLEFLIRLEHRLGDMTKGGYLSNGSYSSWDPDVRQLWELIEKLLKQKAEGNERARNFIREKRKIDKNYARSKKGETR